MAWTLYGVVTSQVGDKDTIVQIPGDTAIQVSVKQYLKAGLGYEYNFLPWVAVAHLAFVVVFVFVFAWAIRFLNFQKR